MLSLAYWLIVAMELVVRPRGDLLLPLSADRSFL